MHKRKQLILIVDDEVIFQTILGDLLGDQYDIRIAGSGVEALQKTMVKPLPDLILLDWIMPDINGLFVCQQLKNHPLTEKIPILFLTAKNDVANELEGFSAGATDYIHKPISPPVLLARVEIQLKLRAIQKELEQQKKELELLLDKRNEELEQSKALALSWLESMVFKNNVKKGIYIGSLKEHIGDAGFEQLLNEEKQKVEIEEEVDHYPKRNEVLKQLDKILANPLFSSAKRTSSLLTFIVNETLDGCGKRLKAFTIAVEVFQRDATFDPQQDPIIRVQAGNLRKRLENYYLTDGVNDSIVIGIPKGGYIAEFSLKQPIP